MILHISSAAAAKNVGGWTTTPEFCLRVSAISDRLRERVLWLQLSELFRGTFATEQVSLTRHIPRESFQLLRRNVLRH